MAGVPCFELGACEVGRDGGTVIATIGFALTGGVRSLGSLGIRLKSSLDDG